MKKKRNILLAALLLLVLAAPLRAQVFMTEDEMNLRTSEDAEDPFILQSGGLEYDQTNWVPVGSGIVLLTALGGAYLLRKKRNCDWTEKSK